MAILYLMTAFIVICANYADVSWAIYAIVSNAFSPECVTGGVIAVLVLGFRRGAFSNEAGTGSSSIAHAAVKTREPISQATSPCSNHLSTRLLSAPRRRC